MKLISLLPFMDSEELNDLAKKIINNEVKGVSLSVLFPFLEDEDLDNLVDDLIKNNATKDLYRAIPFLSKERINDLYKKATSGELKGFKEETLIPFLGKNAIKEIFNNLVKEAMEKPDSTVDEDLSDLYNDEDDKE